MKERPNDAFVQLAFEEKSQYEDFQSGMLQLPSQYRKRKPDDDVAHMDISVTEIGTASSSATSIVVYSQLSLQRVFSGDYRNIDGDIDPSDDCDAESSVSNFSYVSAVEVSQEVQFQLLDKPDSILIWRKKVEKCHLKSQSRFPEVKNNLNNLLYMTRHLHEHFDGFGVHDMVPSFLVKYVKHNADKITHNVSGRTVHVYETTVRVEFIDEEAKSTLCSFFREYTTINSTEIEFQLYFSDPDEFKVFATHKAEETLLKWNSLAGPNDGGDNGNGVASAGGAV